MTEAAFKDRRPTMAAVCIRSDHFTQKLSLSVLENFF